MDKLCKTASYELHALHKSEDFLALQRTGSH